MAIIEAHKDLEKMVLTKHELAFKQIVDTQWSWLAYSGLWQDPLRADLDRFIDATQNRVSGKVRLKMERDRLEWLAENQNILYTETIWQHMPQVQPLTRVLQRGSWSFGGCSQLLQTP